MDGAGTVLPVFSWHRYRVAYTGTEIGTADAGTVPVFTV
jgi:hypothetical protein